MLQEGAAPHPSLALISRVLVSLSAYRKSPEGIPRMPGAPWSLQSADLQEPFEASKVVFVEGLHTVTPCD